MKTLATPTLLIDTRGGTSLSLSAWAQAVRQAMKAGDRLITLFGRPEDGNVVVTAVLQSSAGLAALRARGTAGERFPSLTLEFPAAQIAERELWEQTGLVPDGHPWLKPVRFEGDRQRRMVEYPFFLFRGAEVHEVGVGPIHASVIEPGHFRFMCHGERVQHLEIQLGYQHRGVESLLLRRPPLALTSLIESISGDTSVAYAWGYCAAVEALADVDVGLVTELVRGVALEMERVAMHLVTLAGMATDIAFLQGGATYGRLRTAIINATMRVCGSRFGRGWLRPGGVRSPITLAQCDDLLATLGTFAKDLQKVNGLMRASRSVRSRLQGTGVLGQQAARELGMVGVVAKASGLFADVRRDLPGRLFDKEPVEILTEDDGDCWARMSVRMREIDESVRWLTRVLHTHGAQLSVPPPERLRSLAPHALCITMCEGFRGPVMQAVETDADGALLHYKIRDPSMPNWFGLALALRGNEISDFPICNKSFDLSYCGNDL